MSDGKDSEGRGNLEPGLMEDLVLDYRKAWGDLNKGQSTHRTITWLLWLICLPRA